MSGHTGAYYQCVNCNHITDCSDTHCPECGSQDETELNPQEIKQIANKMIIKGHVLFEMLKSHDDY